MHDYLTQLARKVQQPESASVVQPRPVSMFESARYSSESFDVDRRGEHESQVSPTAGLRTNLDEWTDHSNGKNHDESETAVVMSDDSLMEEGIGQPYRRESMNSLVNRIEPDRQSWEMGKEVAADEPTLQPYKEVVRGERQASREPSFSLSSEPVELSAHVKRTSKAKHGSKQLPRIMESSGLRESTEKPELAIQNAREQEEPILGEMFFGDKSSFSKLSSGRKPAAIADVAPIPSRDKRSPFAEPVLSLHGGEQRAPSPTIQVSIGRIEVRATVASAPARKLQEKSSAMSLHEYLERRNERRR